MTNSPWAADKGTMMRAWNRWFLLTLAASIFFLHIPAARGEEEWVETWEGGLAPLEEVLYAGSYDIVVARIVAVDRRRATNADPPRVTIAIQEVLRGSLPLGRKVIAWEPTPTYDPCGMGRAEENKRWAETPLEGPGTGRRMILAGTSIRSGTWECDVYLREPYSDSLRAEVIRNVEAWKPGTGASWRAAERAHAVRDSLYQERWK